LAGINEKLRPRGKIASMMGADPRAVREIPIETAACERRQKTFAPTGGVDMNSPAGANFASWSAGAR
jgi:hypothetical protein